MWDTLFPSATSYSLLLSQKHGQALIDGWTSHPFSYTLLFEPVTKPVCHYSDGRASGRRGQFSGAGQTQQEKRPCLTLEPVKKLHQPLINH